MHLHGTSYVDDGGHLVIGGCRAVDLARSFGTPLIVYDEALIRERAAAYRDALVRTKARGRIAYASKAFACAAMCRLAQQEGLWLEVVSGGELYTALRAQFPSDRIIMHGNNKTPAELEAAVEAGIGLVVIDNFYEIELLGRILRARGRTQDVLLRVSPGVDAHTHAFVATGKQDSKFGFDLHSGQALLAARAVSADRALQLRGLHAHIGSQIFDFDGFRVAADRLAGLYREIEDVCGHQMDLVNLGGGLGIRYTEEDTLPPIGVAVERVIAAGRAAFSEQGLPEPEWMLEPGRSLVAEAGTTLYTVGSRKDIAGVRSYVAVDGGMTDNPRLALYGSKYEAAVANRMREAPVEIVSIAGKCCESGDMLIWDVHLPHSQAGDILAVSCTGAYTYSMASNYNRIGRPAVVFVKDGRAVEVVKREGEEDLCRLDVLDAI